MPSRTKSPPAEPTVAGPAALDADNLRALAATGMSRAQIATSLRIGQSKLDLLLRRYGIGTSAKRGMKPGDDGRPIHGCSGERPAKLMPSAEAVRCASVWGLGGHASNVFCSSV